MGNDYFYAFYCSYKVRANSGLQAMLNNREVLSLCDSFVEAEDSHVGYRLHVRDEVVKSSVLLRVTFYMRVDVEDLAYQIRRILDFIDQVDFKLERIATTLDEEL